MMIRLGMVAAVFAATSMVAQAAPTSLGLLAPGTYTFDIPLSLAGTGIISDQFSFTLGQSSQVSGTLTGVDSVREMRADRFSEMGNVPPVFATTSVTGGVAAFDFGALSAPSGVGFDSGFYTVTLSGLADGGVSSLKLNLQVSSVPEASSWALMALGLGGLVAVARRRVH